MRRIYTRLKQTSTLRSASPPKAPSQQQHRRCSFKYKSAAELYSPEPNVDQQILCLSSFRAAGATSFRPHKYFPLVTKSLLSTKPVNNSVHEPLVIDASPRWLYPKEGCSIHGRPEQCSGSRTISDHCLTPLKKRQQAGSWWAILLFSLETMPSTPDPYARQYKGPANAERPLAAH